jgi:two-component system, LytTR family, sensor histidine kinase AlgZ
MLRIIGTNVLTAALFALLAGVHGGWASMARSFLVALIYSTVIGTAAQLLLPRVGHSLHARAPAVFWLGMGGTLLGLAAAGSVVAGLVVAALGLYGAGSPWAAMWVGLGVSVVLSLSVGLVITLYETTRSRLAATRESLKTRELEMERAQRMTADARLASLESRLHPHFLFNAIAAIAAEVREAPDRAERLLIEFADLLRASLDSTQRHTVPLGDELAIVRSYLEIEQARLGERLRVKLDVPEELLYWPVPPFALHTLVQNSVKYVAAARPGGAEVRIEARPAGERMALSVWDDGPGFDLTAAAPGHGLETLRTRLGVLFGADAALTAAGEDGGASVTMTVPAHALITERPPVS